MNIAATLLVQVFIMFILAGVGFIMARSGKITDEGSKTLGNILIYLSLPCVIISGFQIERTNQNISKLVISAVLAALILVVSAGVARLAFRKDSMAAFAGAFSNPGFFGVPIIIACLSQDSVFYVAAFIALLNMGQWTYGRSLISGEKQKISFRTIITAPFMIAIIIGLFFFLTGIKIPGVIDKCISYIGGMNTPIAMFTIGVYLSKVDFRSMICKGRLYLVALIRLLVIPLITIVILSFLPPGLNDMRLAILIAAACPVGSNVAVYADLHNKDYPYAVEMVVVSTLFSIITMPLIVQLASVLWRVN
jgi:predicted permease